MKMKKFASIATTIAVFSLAALFTQKARSQELSAQVILGSYNNTKDYVAGVGFAAKRPLFDNLTVGTDLTMAKSKSADLVEACQIWFSYNLSKSVSITPYIWKDRFYGVDPFGVGAVVSVGKLNLIAEYEEPKTNQDPVVWAEGISYSFRLGRLEATPKIIFAQFTSKVVDMLGGELRVSYDAGRDVTPFFKVKTMDLLQTGQCTTNVQAGVGFKL